MMSEASRDLPFEIASTTMDEHCNEEANIEIGDRRRVPDDKAPGKSLNTICRVVLQQERQSQKETLI
jgi:hypothetical protein